MLFFLFENISDYVLFDRHIRIVSNISGQLWRQTHAGNIIQTHQVVLIC